LVANRMALGKKTSKYGGGNKTAAGEGGGIKSTFLRGEKAENKTVISLREEDKINFNCGDAITDQRAGGHWEKKEGKLYKTSIGEKPKEREQSNGQ